jgi:hypothetical protein
MCSAGRVNAIDVGLAGTVQYIAGEIIWILSKKGRHGKSLKDAVTKTPFATVFPAFAVMSAAIIIISFKIF